MYTNIYIFFYFLSELGATHVEPVSDYRTLSFNSSSMYLIQITIALKNILCNPQANYI